MMNHMDLLPTEIAEYIYKMSHQKSYQEVIKCISKIKELQEGDFKIIDDWGKAEWRTPFDEIYNKRKQLYYSYEDVFTKSTLSNLFKNNLEEKRIADRLILEDDDDNDLQEIWTLY